MSEGDVRSQQLKGNIKYIRGRRFYEKKVLWASRVLYLLQIFTKPDLISVQTEQGNHTTIHKLGPYINCPWFHSKLLANFQCTHRKFGKSGPKVLSRIVSKMTVCLDTSL